MVADLKTTDTSSSKEQQNDRIREHTANSINQKIDAKMLVRLTDYARRSEVDIARRIEALDQEWDTERVLETNASILAFVSLILGIVINTNWFWLTGSVLLFLLQHAVQGWCPPLPIIRYLGVRTAQEIAQEKYALKALRGDFSQLVRTSVPEQETRVESVLQAVKA